MNITVVICRLYSLMVSLNPYCTFRHQRDEISLNISSFLQSFSLAPSFSKHRAFLPPLIDLHPSHGQSEQALPEASLRHVQGQVSFRLIDTVGWRLMSGFTPGVNTELSALNWLRYFRKSLQYFETPHNFLINLLAVNELWSTLKLNWKSKEMI